MRLLLLLLCAVFGSTTTVSPAVEDEKAPACGEKDAVIHLCSAGVSLNVSATNPCTNQPSPKLKNFRVNGAQQNANCTVPKVGNWPALPSHSHYTDRGHPYLIYRHERQNFGHLHFPRMCLDGESVQFNLRKPDVERQISINGVDRVDLFRARLQAPLWINGTGPRPRKSTLVKVHRGTIGAAEHARSSGFIMEPGSAIYVRGVHSKGREEAAAVITKNTLHLGAGSKIIVYGRSVVLQFDEGPGTRIKPNVTICVANPLFRMRLVTLKGATADMLSNYVYSFFASVEAYGEPGRDDGIHRIPYPAFSNPVAVHRNPAYKDSFMFGGNRDHTNWKVGDSWSLGYMVAMYHYQEGLFNVSGNVYESARAYAYEYCSKYLKDINKDMKEIKKNDKEYSCDTTPTPEPKTVSGANTHPTTIEPKTVSAKPSTRPTTIGIAPEATTTPSTSNTGVIVGTIIACLAVLGLSVGGLYYWWKKKSVDVDDPGSLSRKGALKGFSLRPVKARPARSASTYGQNRL